jgi:hypothetical protein
MTSHLVTGSLALVLVAVHAGLHLKATAGGYAAVMLGVLAVTGVVGRYFYAFVPREANGREAALEELRTEAARQSAEWDRHGRGFGEHVRSEIQNLVDSAAVGRGFFGALPALARQNRRLKSTLDGLRAKGRREGLTEDQLRSVLALARKTHRTAILTSHYEQLRGLLGTWRFFHRILAIAMVALLIVHLAAAWRYARVFAGF